MSKKYDVVVKDGVNGWVPVWLRRSKKHALALGRQLLAKKGIYAGPDATPAYNASMAKEDEAAKSSPAMLEALARRRENAAETAAESLMKVDGAFGVKVVLTGAYSRRGTRRPWTAFVVR